MTYLYIIFSIAYLQGQYKDWKKMSCDNTFFRNMMTICGIRHSRKRTSLWQKIKIALTLGYDMIKWLTISDDTLKHCQHGANMFYKAVVGFGDGSFGDKGSYKECKKPCVLLGKPKKKLP